MNVLVAIGLVLLAFSWVVSGVVAYALMVGYWAGRYPELWVRDARWDRTREAMWALSGPVALAAAMTFVLSRKHGQRFGLKF